MSWSLSVSGHLEGADAADQEATVMAHALEFVKGAMGVTYASWTGQFNGGHDLKAEAQASSSESGEA